MIIQPGSTPGLNACRDSLKLLLSVDLVYSQAPTAPSKIYRQGRPAIVGGIKSEKISV
jgi:hypothetical protein